MKHPMPDDGTYDLERDLRPLDGYYALTALIGCAVLCIAPVLLACVVWALIAWL